MSRSAGIGEPLDPTAASPQREIDTEHRSAGGEIDQQITRLQTDLFGQCVLYSFQKIRIGCHPGLQVPGNVAGGEIQGSLMEMAGPDADGELVVVATDEHLH